MNVVDRDVCNRMPTSLLIQELCNRYMCKEGDIVVIHADSEVVPLSFSLRNDGQVRVNSLRLSLRFGLSEDFMFLDEEVYNT
jgi:hypothetical protein